MLKKKFKKKLEAILVKHLEVKKSTVLFTCDAVASMLKYGSVMHKKIALSIEKETLYESQIRRVERFFAERELNVNVSFFKMLYEASSITEKVTVLIDRTNWDFGKKHINILVASIVWNNSALPIVWKVFDKKGNSNTSERKNLIKALDKVIGIENIEAILGDREFIGNEWFQFLNSRNVPFIIRLKSNLYVTSKSGERVKVGNLMRIVEQKRIRKIEGFTINGIPIVLAATRSTNDELVIVAASKNVSGNILSYYRVRWLIELFFKSIKSKGFNFEETHMSDPERISQLFAIVALASLLIVKAGALRALFKKIPVKNHERRLFSVFTYGLDFLQLIFLKKKCSGAPKIFCEKFMDMLFDEKWNFAFAWG